MLKIIKKCSKLKAKVSKELIFGKEDGKENSHLLSAYYVPGLFMQLILTSQWLWETNDDPLFRDEETEHQRG